jgi:hypothetical protein
MASESSGVRAGKSSLKRRGKTRCFECQRKLGLGVKYKHSHHFCGERCVKAYGEHLRIGLELVQLARRRFAPQRAI